jgi:hypothetical protein
MVRSEGDESGKSATHPCAEAGQLLGANTDGSNARDETGRVLFLDDDPDRAEAFLREHPEAVWVTTAADCIERLCESWDEVHLDHDLGGRKLVEVTDVECGMEVVRWIGREPREHLRNAHFLVHTHNLAAGLQMVLEMCARGYRAELRPFGLEFERMLREGGSEPVTEADSASEGLKDDARPAAARSRWLGWLRRLRR